MIKTSRSAFPQYKRLIGVIHLMCSGREIVYNRQAFVADEINSNSNYYCERYGWGRRTIRNSESVLLLTTTPSATFLLYFNPLRAASYFIFKKTQPYFIMAPIDSLGIVFGPMVTSWVLGDKPAVLASNSTLFTKYVTVRIYQ